MNWEMETNCVYRALAKILPPEKHQVVLKVCESLRGIDGMPVRTPLEKLANQGHIMVVETRPIPSTDKVTDLFNDVVKILESGLVVLVHNNASSAKPIMRGHAEAFTPKIDEIGMTTLLSCLHSVVNFGGEIYSIQLPEGSPKLETNSISTSL